MGIESILKNLLDDKLILSEAYQTGHKIFSDHIEVFKNPDMSEIRNVIKKASYDGAKVGTDEEGNVFVWTDDVLHSIMEKALGIRFTLKFDYTKGNQILFLAGDGDTEKQWKEHSGDLIIQRMRSIFPDIKSIEMVSHPFSVMHTYS